MILSHIAYLLSPTGLWTLILPTAPSLLIPNVLSHIAYRPSHTELWTRICDAKMRKRRPNGAIITEEEEAAEAEKAKQDVLAKAALWAEREAHMKTDF